jgi:phosphatidylglycerol:prolipoprotein diacylglycerol transferase
VHNGLVQACDFSTLPVHPTQAYEILCCLLIAVLVWRFRRYLKAPGSILLFSVILYSCSRFFIEFFRDPDNSFIPFYFLGIKLIQWMVLAGIVILAGLLVTREKIFSRKTVIETTVEPALFRRVSLSLVLLFLFLLTKNWFDLTERTAAFVIVLPSIVLAGTDLFRHFSVPKYRFLTILVFCSSFFLMSQTYIPQNAGEKIKYKEISIGGIAGAYNTSFKKMMQVWVPPYEYQDCGGDTVIYPGHYDNILGLPQKLRHQSYVGSAGITFHEVRSKYRRSEWGFYVFGGNETESLSDGSYQKKNLILGINPSFRFDWKWIGFGYGFYAGTFRFSQFRSSENTGAGSQEIVRNLPFFPQLSFRVGPYDILFAEVNLNRQFPSGSPLQLLRFGLGTGFGKTDGTRLGIGYSTTGFYGETYIPIKEKFAIEASYANTLQPDMKAAWCFSLGLHYRFDFKTAKVTVREKKEPIPKHRIQKSNDN